MTEQTNNYQMKTFGMHVLSDESELIPPKYQNNTAVSKTIKKSLPNPSDYDDGLLKLIKSQQSK